MTGEVGTVGIFPLKDFGLPPPPLSIASTFFGLKKTQGSCEFYLIFAPFAREKRSVHVHIFETSQETGRENHFLPTDFF